MKSIQQLRSDYIHGDVYSVNDFVQMIIDHRVSPHTGNGFFHDGEKETNVSVWDEGICLEDFSNYKYVCWYGA